MNHAADTDAKVRNILTTAAFLLTSLIVCPIIRYILYY